MEKQSQTQSKELSINEIYFVSQLWKEMFGIIGQRKYKMYSEIIEIILNSDYAPSKRTAERAFEKLSSLDILKKDNGKWHLDKSNLMNHLKASDHWKKSIRAVNIIKEIPVDLKI